MASLIQSHAKKIDMLNQENQLLQCENYRLKKKLGIKDDIDVIDINSESEEESESQSNDLSNSEEQSDIDEEKENRRKDKWSTL